MSSLKKLKEDFDRVLIKYTDKSCEVLLVKGLSVFSGSSKCHENDNFDRKLGRTIALGRAEFASKVSDGTKQSRGNSYYIKEKHGVRESLKHSGIKCGDINQVDEIIIDFLPKRKED